MNPLTARFLAYRKQPKKLAPPLPVVDPKFPKGLYPHCGFLTKEETMRERMGRLVEAKAVGYKFSEEDFQFWRSRIIHEFQWLKRGARKAAKLQEHLRMKYEYGTKYPLSGCFR